MHQTGQIPGRTMSNRNRRVPKQRIRTVVIDVTGSRDEQVLEYRGTDDMAGELQHTGAAPSGRGREAEPQVH
jgi:hypothetical protein